MFNFSKYEIKKRLTNILSIITFIICGSCLWAENIFDVNRLIQNEEYTQARIILEKLSKNDKTKTEANYVLGVIYNEGLGVKQDFNKAIIYFKKAADDRNIDAMINLGGLFISQLELQDIRKSYSWFLKAAELGDAQAFSALSGFHQLGYIFPPNKSYTIRFALLAKKNGWQFSEDYFNKTVVEQISEKSLTKLNNQLQNCSKPFGRLCEISKPLELDNFYLRTSDIKFYKFNKGLFLDTNKVTPLDKIYNHYINENIPLPTIFLKKDVDFNLRKNKPNICLIRGDALNLLWYSNSNMPKGKYLEFNKKDSLQFECEKISIHDEPKIEPANSSVKKEIVKDTNAPSKCDRLRGYFKILTCKATERAKKANSEK